MDHTFGEWFWETRTVQSGPAAAWENPGNGWGPSCTTWAKMQTCIADPNQGPDFMFALRGKKS